MVNFGEKDRKRQLIQKKGDIGVFLLPIPGDMLESHGKNTSQKLEIIGKIKW